MYAISDFAGIAAMLFGASLMFAAVLTLELAGWSFKPSIPARVALMATGCGFLFLGAVVHSRRRGGDR